MSDMSEVIVLATTDARQLSHFIEKQLTSQATVFKYEAFGITILVGGSDGLRYLIACCFVPAVSASCCCSDGKYHHQF